MLRVRDLSRHEHDTSSVIYMTLSAEGAAAASGSGGGGIGGGGEWKEEEYDKLRKGAQGGEVRADLRGDYGSVALLLLLYTAAVLLFISTGSI